MAAGSSTSSSYASRSSARPKYTRVRCQDSLKPIGSRSSRRAGLSLHGGVVEEYRADPHDRGALLDRDGIVLRGSHGEVVQPVGAGELAQRGEMGAARLWIGREGRHGHEPGNPDGAAGDEAAELVGGDAGLALLTRHVDLEQHLRVRRGVALELAQRGVGGDGVDELHERDDLAHLAALELADEVPAEAVAMGGTLLLELLGAVLAEQRDAGLRQRAEVVGLDVLHGGEQLHGLRVAARASRGRLDSRAHPVGVGADDVDVQARHTTPAWRPVTPPSRRWEKNSARSAHIVHRPVSRTSATPAASSCARATASRARLRPPRRASYAANRAWTSSPTSQQHPRAAGPSAAVIGPSPPRSRSAATPSARMPPASPRQPPCSAATAPRAVSATGRQSAVNTSAAAPASAVAWPSSSSAGRSADGGSVARRTRAPRTRRAYRKGSRGTPTASASRARFASTLAGSSAVRRPRLSDANGPSDTPPRRVEKSTRPPSRSAATWPPSQRNGDGSGAPDTGGILEAGVDAASRHRRRLHDRRGGLPVEQEPVDDRLEVGDVADVHPHDEAV